AQPVEALRGALDHLFASGNYGWRETRQTEVNGRSSITPFGIGRTEIDRVTLATIYMPQNIRAAFVGPRTAFKLEDGWKRAEDLTDDDIVKIFGLRISPTMPAERAARMMDSKRKYKHAIFHDVLRLLLKTASDLREEDGVIVGSALGFELQMFVESGEPPRTRPQPSLFGISLPTPPRRPPRAMPGQTITFRAWLTDGKFSKFSIQFLHKGAVRDGSRAGEEFSIQFIYTVELTDIGTSKFEVAPEIAALFNDMAGAP
ncbi:MAG: hypothetical protein ABIZ49_01435, partial [Opitutaceae bacterium]